MILRSIRSEVLFLFSYFLVNGALHAKADTPFDCRMALNNTKLDLTSLAGEHTVNRTRDTSPTVTIDSLRFDLCDDLKTQSGVPNYDQCPSGTRACLTKFNKKQDHAELIISVIPVAQTSMLEPVSSVSFAPKYLSLLFHGPEYPPTSPSNPQSLNLTIFCDPQGISDPKFVSYDGSRLDIEWSAPVGCHSEGEDDNKDQDKEKGDPEKEAVGSGVGWFFLVLLLALLAYFGLGAYYNYSTYGATGLDLIPHRDFWKEVPFMLNDVMSHLCSNIRPRRTSSRGGYISV